MELPDLPFNKAEYIETASGNRVSRQSVLCGSQNIILNGKNIVQSEAIIRGDLANVRVGRHCVISSKAVIRPPFKKFSKGVAFFPMQIGDHVFIGEGSVINAAIVNSYVYIGKNCVIGRRCTIRDCCYIEDGTILPPETVVPAFSRSQQCNAKISIQVYFLSRISGSPGRVVGELPECSQDIMTDFTKSYYQHFKPVREQ